MSKPHLSNLFARELRDYASRHGDYPPGHVVWQAAAEIERLVEQFETFLDAAWKFEREMANHEFVHFGEFRRALVAATGEDRGSNPASSPPTASLAPYSPYATGGNPASEPDA